MSNKKNELVVKKNADLVVPQPSVDFSAKLTTNDLVDSIVLESEEHYLAERKRLVAEANKLCEDHAKCVIYNNELLLKHANSYSNKEVNNLMAVLAAFTGKKYTLAYRTEYTPKKTLNIWTEIAPKNDRYYSRIEKKIVEKAPQNLIDSDKAVSDCVKAMEQNRQNQEKVNDALKELPQLKKRVRATLVKNKMASLSDGKKIMDSLTKVVLEHAKNN